MPNNTQPQLWKTQLGSNADVNTLPDTSSGGEASMKELFPARTQLPLDAGGVAPTRADFNALFKLLGDNVYFVQHGGIYAWDSTISYDKGALALYGSVAYVSLADANRGNTPGASPAWSAVALMTDVNRSTPAGSLMAYAGTSSVPDGWLLCNGAAVSRTAYATLFAVIGTAYGAGNGSTTFALPDYRDRVLQGASASHAAGTYIAAGLPNITGSRLMQHNYIGAGWDGALSYSKIGESWTTANLKFVEAGVDNLVYAFNASKSNTLYGRARTVQPPAAAIQYLIKY